MPDQNMIEAGFDTGRFMIELGKIYSEYTKDPDELSPNAPSVIFTAMIDHIWTEGAK